MADQTSQSDFGESLASSSERIEVIIEAAERAAAGIIEDAESQARTYLDESRRRADEVADERARALSGLADNLLGRAEAVKEQSADLILALEAARAQIADHISDYSARVRGQASSPPAPHLQPVVRAEPETTPTHEPVSDDAEESTQSSLEPEAEPEEPPATPPPMASTPPRRPATEPSASARLLATQMAVAGSSRAEIADRLEHEFGVADPDSMLDAILGPRT